MPSNIIDEANAGEDVDPRLTMGKRFADLVLVQDSNAVTEFRVQCEVVLDEDTARQVQDALWGPGGATKQSVEKARELVTAKIPPAASTRLREIVARGFDDKSDHP
jgi:hypothetical protein